MKLRDLKLENCQRVFIKFLTAKNFTSICKHGVDIEVAFLDGHFFGWIHTSSQSGFQTIALFPVSGSSDFCKVVNDSIDKLNSLGYLKCHK